MKIITSLMITSTVAPDFWSYEIRILDISQHFHIDTSRKYRIINCLIIYGSFIVLEIKIEHIR